MKPFSRKVSNATCYVFYTLNFERDKTKDLFSYLLGYFSKMSARLEYMSYYNESYEINYGHFDKLRAKVEVEKWNELVHFEFDDKDVRDPNRVLSIEFNITRPNVITVLLADTLEFDLINFCRGLFAHFKLMYGFRYEVVMSEWATAYAIGDWQHCGGVGANIRNSKQLIQQWNKKCESIKDGFIRDVYQDNILSKVHLDQVKNDVSLREYIEGGGHGEIEAISSEIFIWSIKDEDQFREVRDFAYERKIVLQ